MKTQTVKQPKWQRITLLSVLGYEGAGCIAGGIMLVKAPDGKLMDMPVDLMNGVFRDFMVPGIILFLLGLLNAAAFVAVLRRSRFDWIMASLALGGLIIWFIIEIAILQELHWLHAMWGLPVVIGYFMIIPLYPLLNESIRKALLIGGILSSLLYVLLNIVVPTQWKEYNSVSQTVSELSAINAPTRLLWMLLCIPYTLLAIAFGWGVLKSAGSNRALHFAGLLLVIYGALGFVWPLAPMHLRETIAAGGATRSDTMHIALGVVTEILFLVSMGFAAAALGKTFRIYSIITFFVLLVFGILTFMEAPGISTNQPTPLIGVWERINIGVFLLWVIILARVLIKRKPVLAE